MVVALSPPKDTFIPLLPETILELPSLVRQLGSGSVPSLWGEYVVPGICPWVRGNRGGVRVHEAIPTGRER